MKDLPNFSNIDEEMQYIREHLPELMDDAINDYISGNRSKELLDRFRKLRPYDHDVAQYYIDEIDKDMKSPETLG